MIRKQDCGKNTWSKSKADGATDLLKRWRRSTPWLKRGKYRPKVNVRRFVPRFVRHSFSSVAPCPVLDNDILSWASSSVPSAGSPHTATETEPSSEPTKVSSTLVGSPRRPERRRLHSIHPSELNSLVTAIAFMVVYEVRRGSCLRDVDPPLSCRDHLSHNRTTDCQLQPHPVTEERRECQGVRLCTFYESSREDNNLSSSGTREAFGSPATPLSPSFSRASVDHSSGGTWRKDAETARAIFESIGHEDAVEERALCRRPIPRVKDVAFFLIYLQQKTSHSHECFIIALVYLARLLVQPYVLHLSRNNWRPLLFAALLLAHKYWEKTDALNKDFVAGYPPHVPRDADLLETCFLLLLGHNTLVPPAVYAQCYSACRIARQCYPHHFTLRHLPMSPSPGGQRLGGALQTPLRSTVSPDRNRAFQRSQHPFVPAVRTKTSDAPPRCSCSQCPLCTAYDEQIVSVFAAQFLRRVHSFGGPHFSEDCRQLRFADSDLSQGSTQTRCFAKLRRMTREERNAKLNATDEPHCATDLDVHLHHFTETTNTLASRTNPSEAQEKRTPLRPNEARASPFARLSCVKHRDCSLHNAAAYASPSSVESCQTFESLIVAAVFPRYRGCHETSVESQKRTDRGESERVVHATSHQHCSRSPHPQSVLNHVNGLDRVFVVPLREKLRLLDPGDFPIFSWQSSYGWDPFRPSGLFSQPQRSFTEPDDQRRPSLDTTSSPSLLNARLRHPLRRYDSFDSEALSSHRTPRDTASSPALAPDNRHPLQLCGQQSSLVFPVPAELPCNNPSEPYVISSLVYLSNDVLCDLKSVGEHDIISAPSTSGSLDGTH